MFERSRRRYDTNRAPCIEDNAEGLTLHSEVTDIDFGGHTSSSYLKRGVRLHADSNGGVWESGIPLSELKSTAQEGTACCDYRAHCCASGTPLIELGVLRVPPHATVTIAYENGRSEQVDAGDTGLVPIGVVGHVTRITYRLPDGQERTYCAVQQQCPGITRDAIKNSTPVTK